MAEAVDTSAVAMREWLADAPLPWPPAADLDAGDRIVACYSVTHASIGRTKHDKAYLRLKLSDLHGTIEARVWDGAEALGAIAQPGTYVGVRGRVEVFKGERQVNIEQLERVRVDPEDLGFFMPRSSRDFAEMETELMELVTSVEDASLRKLLRALLGPKTETGAWFRRAPAAKRNHHACVGGLLEHTISVTRLCDALARHYGPVLDRDLLVTGALLHDIGKVREIATEAGFPYTTEGKLLGHILLGLEMVRDAGRGVGVPDSRLRLIEHLMAAHQGRYEWQSPREPQTLEALALHYADDTDAKLQQAIDLLRRSEPGWTEYSRAFGRELLKHDGARAAAAEPPADPTGRPDPDTLSLFD